MPFKKFPEHASVNNVYPAVENDGGWNTGFWTGILWHAYQMTGDEKYKKVALHHVPSFHKRIVEKLGVDHHDMGFLYTPSCVAAYKITGDEMAKEAAVLAADNLISRYHEKAGFIQAWGIYGPLLTYIYKKNDKALEVFKATTNYYLNHLPEDYIAFWDLSFTDGDDEPRDSSSNAIALCGMLEGIKYMDKNDPLRKVYVNACNRIMNSLIDNYLTKDIPESNGLLLHATYGKPQKNGVDEMNIWGDYFYMEALHRMLDPDWRLYW